MGSGSMVGLLMLGLLCSLPSCAESDEATLDPAKSTQEEANAGPGSAMADEMAATSGAKMDSMKDTMKDTMEDTMGDAEAATKQSAKVDIKLGLSAWKLGGCAVCHGSDGSGGMLGPDLTNGEWLNCDGTIEGIRAILESGVAKDQMGDRTWMAPMPPATDKIKDGAAIDALAAYVQGLAK